MSLNKLGSGLCGGQQQGDTRFSVAPIPPASPQDGIFARGATTGTYTEVGAADCAGRTSGLHWRRRHCAH